MRKPLSKRTRFKVFQRDEFTCMYCWRNPQDHKIALEVDHKISVKDWWTNDIINLVTSCYDCNRWKRWDSIITWTELEDTKFELEKIKDRLEQIQYISNLKTYIKEKEKEIEDNKFAFIQNIMVWYSDIFINKMQTRIRNQYKKYWYDIDILEEALHITENKFSYKEEFYQKDYMKYFHWVLNNIIQR